MSSADATFPRGTPTGPQLNPEQIDMLKDLQNGALLPQMLRTYRDDARVQIDRIRAAVSSGDWDAVATSAHYLKSGSFVIGADGIGILCASMEAAARSGALPNGAELGSQLVALYSALLPELEQHLNP